MLVKKITNELAIGFLLVHPLKYPMINQQVPVQ